MKGGQFPLKVTVSNVLTISAYLPDCVLSNMLTVSVYLSNCVLSRFSHQMPQALLLGYYDCYYLEA